MKPMFTFTCVEARNRFGRLLNLSRREPVAVTRHGRPAAFIVSPQDMEALLALRARRGRAVQALEAWGTRAEALANSAALALPEDEINRLVHALR